VLDPGEPPGQRVVAKAAAFRQSADRLHTAVDLTDAYRNTNRPKMRVFRGMALLADNRGAIVRDHIDQAGGTLPYLFTAHTRVRSARFVGTDRKAVVLDETGTEGRRLLVFVKENGLTFEAAADGSPLHAAAPNPGSPRPFWDPPAPGTSPQVQQNQNVNFRKLKLNGTVRDWVNATVVFYSLLPSEPEVVPTISDERYNMVPESW
jgi:hypothetical protein